MSDRPERPLDRRRRRHFLAGSLLNGPDDRIVTRAAADIPFVPAVDLVERRVGVLFEQSDGCHDEARRAKTALSRSLLQVCLLNGMKPAVASGNAFDRYQIRSSGALDRYNAGS